MNKRPLKNISASIHQRLLNIARDIDFPAYVRNSPENLAAVFREVCTMGDPDDGLVFDPNTVEAIVRIIHHASIIEIDGVSYRKKHQKKT